MPRAAFGEAPDVTVLIAAYNCEEFVERAILSALDQQDVRVEVAVVDDCSTDRTVETVRTLAGGDPRIRLIERDTNGGPSAARSAGIDAARGRWIAVLDADDAMVPERLARLIRAGEDDGADIVVDNWRHFDAATGSVSSPVLAGRPAREVLDLDRYLEKCRPYGREPDYGLLKPVIRREFLARTGVRYPAGVRHGEDFEFALALLSQGAHCLLVRDFAGYLYTARSSGWSRTVINDRGLIKRTRALLDLPDVRYNPARRALVAKRITELQRLELDRLAGLPANLRPRKHMLRRALASAEGHKWLYRALRRKLARRSARARDDNQPVSAST